MVDELWIHFWALWRSASEQLHGKCKRHTEDDPANMSNFGDVIVYVGMRGFQPPGAGIRGGHVIMGEHTPSKQ